MRELVWAITLMIPWPHTTIDKLVIYTFSNQQECVGSIPSVKRKHRLFFKKVNCVQIGSGTAMLERPKIDISWLTIRQDMPR